MDTAHLSELRLTSFKSFRDAVLPLGDVTLLIGRNSSGKSNALDGLEVLARLAGGEELADALDGRRREGGAIRGGSAGLPPHGTDAFELGCTVSLGDQRYLYDVRIEVRPWLRVVREHLHGPGVSVKSGTVKAADLFQTRESENAPGLSVEVHNGKRGANAAFLLRDSRVVLTQLASVVPGANRAEASVLRGVEAVLSALRGVFHLDPVPHLMRDYVPQRDSQLRRTAENLSAALMRLESQDLPALRKIVEHIRAVADDRVQGVSFVTSDLGDIMFALDEARGGTSERIPAREMSDGLLRFTAVAAALLTSRHLDIDPGSPVRDGHAGTDGGVHVVIEELENGLHPSQASRLLELVRESVDPRTRVLATTHSPALLDAAEGVLNDSVYMCHRVPETGFSAITPLGELPGYARALAERSLGGAVTADSLLCRPEGDFSEFAQLLGLG